MSEVEAKIKTGNGREENYFLTLSDASKITGYTPEHLNLLCRKGILKGKKFGRNWHTTREWINEFLFLPKVAYKKKYKRRKKRNPVALNVETKTQPAGVKFDEYEEREISHFSENEKIKFQNFIRPEKESEKVREGEAEIKKTSWPKFFFKFSLAVFISFLIFFSVSFYKYSKSKKYFSEKNIPENVSGDSFIFDGTSGRVEGEEDVKGDETQNQAASISSSENFKMREISFGGVLVASANGENLPIEISDMKSEIFMTKDGKQAEILISWKTNKLATSEVEYSKSDVKNPKVLEENNYGFNHSVLLAKLDLGTTYVYRIKTKDRWGNEIASERFGIYSGSKLVSVFDLIIKAVDETFSWAIKK